MRAAVRHTYEYTRHLSGFQARYLSRGHDRAGLRTESKTSGPLRPASARPVKSGFVSTGRRSKRSGHRLRCVWKSRGSRIVITKNGSQHTTHERTEQNERTTVALGVEMNTKNLVAHGIRRSLKGTTAWCGHSAEHRDRTTTGKKRLQLETLAAVIEKNAESFVLFKYFLLTNIHISWYS